MSINCSEVENFNNSLEQFNAIKIICDDLVKYIRTYKQLTFDYTKKLANMQSNFSAKLSKSDSEITKQLKSQTGKMIELIDETIGCFKLSIEELESRAKEFESDLKKKYDDIKMIQKKSSEQNKILINSFNEINKAKKNYLDSISKTEDITNKYYSDKKIIDDNDLGLEKKININDYHLLKEKLKSELNDVNNSIKASKNFETVYQYLITGSFKIHEDFKKNYNLFNNKINSFSINLSEQIKSLLLSFYLTFKNSYRQPIISTDLNINSINTINMGKEIEIILNSFKKDDNSLKNVTPIKYNLKTLEFLKENNYLEKQEININSDDSFNDDDRSKLGRKSISKLEDGFSQMQYISDSSIFMTIKTLFSNFYLIKKDELNFELEEIKFKTQQYILKIESNMNSYPYAKLGPLRSKKEENDFAIIYNRNELTGEELSDLIKLLNHHESRIIFLQKLSDYRSKGKYFLVQKDFDLLLNYFNIIADKVKEEVDYHCAEMIIILSQTYFIEKGDKISDKKYIQVELAKNKLFRDKTFWEEFLVYMINKEIMKTQRRDKKIKENKTSSDYKLSNVVFSQLLTLIDNMAEFGCDYQTIKDIIEPKVFYYKINDNLKKTINDVLNSKFENKKEKKEEKLEQKKEEKKEDKKDVSKEEEKKEEEKEEKKEEKKEESREQDKKEEENNNENEENKNNNDDNIEEIKKEMSNNID